MVGPLGCPASISLCIVPPFACIWFVRDRHAPKLTAYHHCTLNDHSKGTRMRTISPCFGIVPVFCLYPSSFLFLPKFYHEPGRAAIMKQETTGAKDRLLSLVTPTVRFNVPMTKALVLGSRIKRPSLVTKSGSMRSRGLYLAPTSANRQSTRLGAVAACHIQHFSHPIQPYKNSVFLSML